MHLLNLDTMKLESFGNENAPRYAILSHTWGKEGSDEPEVLFQDWNDALQNDLLNGMADPGAPANWPDGCLGRKLLGFCKKARPFGVRYVWVDTLCIDKRVRKQHKVVMFMMTF